MWNLFFNSRFISFFTDTKNIEPTVSIKIIHKMVKTIKVGDLIRANKIISIASNSGHIIMTIDKGEIGIITELGRTKTTHKTTCKILFNSNKDCWLTQDEIVLI